MVTHKVDRCLADSLTMADRPTQLLNLDPFINRNVTQATDPRVFGSPLGRWIYVEVALGKS
jgi:hypothetical protein